LKEWGFFVGFGFLAEFRISNFGSRDRIWYKMLVSSRKLYPFLYADFIIFPNLPKVAASFCILVAQDLCRSVQHLWILLVVQNSISGVQLGEIVALGFGHVKRVLLHSEQSNETQNERLHERS
jgi:hypothetical protein